MAADLRRARRRRPGLTRRASTFSRRDVFQALCERVPAGALVDARAIEAATDRFLASPHAVALLPAHGEGEAYRRSDGRLLPIERDELVYSTPELLALEQRLIRQVAASRDTGAGVTGESAVRAAVASRPTLSAEQRRMVERLCLDGDGVSVVVGKAGTGKTFALGAAREAWQAAGLPGARGRGRAARRARARARRRDPEHERRRPARRLATTGRCRSGACSSSTRRAWSRPGSSRELVDAAAAVGGKLVLVGDHRQLPELEAGGAFRGLVNRGLAVELTENHRQVNPWERAALDELRDGRAEQALARYQAHDRIHVDDTPERSRARLVADWWAVGDPSRSVMLAQRRDDVRDLNARAREHMRAAGRLGDPELRLPGGAFAVGDHVLVKRNDLRLGVVNGDRGRVTAVDPETRQLTLDLGGEQVTLGPGLPRRPDRPWRPDAAARLRDDRPRRPRPHRRPRLRARRPRAESRARLHRAQPRPRDQPPLRRARPRDGARRVRARRPAPHRPDRAPRRPTRDELGDHARDRHGRPGDSERAPRRRANETTARPSLDDAPRRPRAAAGSLTAAASSSSSATPRPSSRDASRPSAASRPNSDHGARPFVEDRDDHTQYREMARLHRRAATAARARPGARPGARAMSERR